jgi:hypothetical protein
MGFPPLPPLVDYLPIVPLSDFLAKPFWPNLSHRQHHMAMRVVAV